MTTTDDLERHLYRAITGNRLGHGSHTIPNALKAIAAVSKTPWSVVGVSRETWRRWNKGIQGMKPENRAGLLRSLRRLRLSQAREARLRQGAITARLWSNYEQSERTVGPQTLGWTAAASGRVVDAYLARGIAAAARAFRESIGSDHFAEWLSAEAHGSQQSYDVLALDLTTSPPRGASTRARQRRRS